MINILVLKVASRCNLNCSYCYMYNLEDDTYKKQPKFMTYEIVDSLISNVKDHVKKYNIENFHFIFHGGEPLLAPKEWYTNFVKKAEINLPNIRLEFSIQSNAVLYDSEWTLHLQQLGIGIGFSWDGPKDQHNKFRVDHKGKGSYDEVIKGIQIHKEIIGKVGGLSVLNAEILPELYYSNIKDIGIDAVSILLPNYHYDMSQAKFGFAYDRDFMTFGKWLAKLFKIWWYDKDENKPQIVFFNDIINLLIGNEVITEAFGNEELNVLVIETNGDIESSAAFKSISNGFTKEGLNVTTNSLSDALETETVQLLLNSHINLCEECLNCSISEVCVVVELIQDILKKRDLIILLFIVMI